MKYPQTIRSILIPLFAAGITAGSTIACAATDIVEPQDLVRQYAKACSKEWFRNRMIDMPKEEAFKIQTYVNVECRRLAHRHVTELAVKREEEKMQAVVQVDGPQSALVSIED